jgi:predicted nucleic acid-binding protein
VYLDDMKQQRRLIDSALFAHYGLNFEVPNLTDMEQSLFVAYAESVDDGEAQSLAIAKGRDLPILTDDVAGIKLALREGIHLRTTIGLVRAWSTSQSSIEVRKVLNKIEKRGRYRPPTDHPDYGWYLAVNTE